MIINYGKTLRPGDTFSAVNGGNYDGVTIKAGDAVTLVSAELGEEPIATISYRGEELIVPLRKVHRVSVYHIIRI